MSKELKEISKNKPPPPPPPWKKKQLLILSAKNKNEALRKIIHKESGNSQ